MLGKKVLPSTASLWLYGSRARGTANTESDWDLLILLDEDKQKTTDKCILPRLSRMLNTIK